MNDWTRRSFLTAATAASATACAAPRATSSAELDRRVAAARSKLYASVPGTEQLAERASGMLIIPEVKEAAFFLSGAYGEGSLMIKGATVEYFSMSAAAFGLQFGAQEFNQALFFMTEDALRHFRVADGWQLGVDAEAAVFDQGESHGTSTTTMSRPIYEVVYGQRGLILGVSLEGAKYSRLIR